MSHSGFSSFGLPVLWSFKISLASTIASNSTVKKDAIPWEYIQSNQSLDSWSGPVPQWTRSSVLTPKFPLPSQCEFYYNRPVYKMHWPLACYMAMTGILHNEASTWMGLTLPRIKEDTNLSNTIVLAFEFHPFVIFSSQCLRFIHSALTENHWQKPIPVYAEPLESDFPEGHKSDIYLSDVITVTQHHCLTQQKSVLFTKTYLDILGCTWLAETYKMCSHSNHSYYRTCNNSQMSCWFCMLLHGMG